MKRVLYIVLTGLLLLAACDKIDAPYVRQNEDPTPNPGDTSQSDTSVFVKVKKVLLEEFTGHLCVNCPSAHELAKELAEQYEGKLSIVSIHAGYQAVTEGEFPEDFTCSVGDEIFAEYNNPFNPMGLINRNNSIPSISSAWTGEIAEEMALEPEFAILLTPTYDTLTRLLNLNMKIKSWGEYSASLRYCVFITENDIIAPQKNNDPTIGETPVIEDYHHMHVLRGSMNGTWGNELGDTFVTDQEISKNLSLTLNEEWNASNCNAVAFIFDVESKRILQVEEIKVIK
jgi:thiol-disulfide isomerase/thioredoxin